MVHRILILIVAALASLGSPRPARASETAAELIAQVSALRTAGRFAEAAKLADENARSEELDASTRVALGGLARQNYELSFGAGGAPTDLCKAAAILRLVAPLDLKGGAAKLVAAEDAEKKLAAALGPTWRLACSPTPSDTSSNMSADERDAGTSVSPDPGAPHEPRPPMPPDPSLELRRVRAGVGTLVPGLVMLASTVGLLAYRAAGERDFLALNLVTAHRTPTAAEYAEADTLSRRYTATTSAAIVLGVTSAALIVTGTTLLAIRTRPRRMAVTPWGTRGLGGLMLQGRF